jgi:hypothetical protein
MSEVPRTVELIISAPADPRRQIAPTAVNRIITVEITSPP